MGALAALVPPHERPLVRELADQLHRDAMRLPWHWRHRPPEGLVRRVSLVVAAIAPHLPYDRVALLVRYALWTFLLDDRMDGSDAGGSHREVLAAVRAGVADRPGDAATGHPDPLASDLTGIRRELSGYDRSGQILPRFDDALRRAVAGDACHARLAAGVVAGAAEPPSTERYLAVAGHTVNYLSFAYALLAVGTAPLTSDDLDRLTPALWHAACAVRLANDLRSVSRDRAEQRLNVLFLPTPAGVPVTLSWVRQRTARSSRTHDRMLAASCYRSSEPACMLIRSARISVQLYQLGDLRGDGDG